MEHIESCFQLEKEECSRRISLHGEPITEHFFSGWPGAYCLKCFEEDKDELCIGYACACPCHNDFWEAYNNATPPPDVSGTMEDDVRFGTSEEQGEQP